MKNKTRNELLASARFFGSKLQASGLKGPKTTQMFQFLEMLYKRFGNGKPTVLATNAPDAPKRKAPTGMFSKRERNIKLGNKLIPVTSITQAEQKIAELKLPNAAAEIAAAIKAAYPENNYTEQRYISAMKAIERRAKQQVEEPTEDAEEVTEE